MPEQQECSSLHWYICAHAHTHICIIYLNFLIPVYFSIRDNDPYGISKSLKYQLHAHYQKKDWYIHTVRFMEIKKEKHYSNEKIIDCSSV